MTAIVPVKDRREQMLRCLDGLLAQDHPNYEILVVDNCSSDGTPEAVRERAAGCPVPVRVEVLPGTVGEIRNRAAELAQTEFVAFTDSDCIPAPGWLRAVCDMLAASPRLGVVQGRTLPQEEVVQGWPATLRIEEFTGRYEGCNLAFRRTALVESGGFDPKVGHFWEDVAAGFAIKRAGWEAAYAPEGLVYHDVTYPGFWWHVERMQRNRNLAPVLARYPEIRRELLFWRVFLTPRDAKFVALLAGAMLARRSPAAILLAAPYVHFVLREGRPEAPAAKRRVIKGYAQAVVYDSARVIGLLRGGLRNGRIVL